VTVGSYGRSSLTISFSRAGVVEHSMSVGSRPRLPRRGGPGPARSVQSHAAIFYKGYPSLAQEQQPGARFGSDTTLAYWHPQDATARKVRVLLRPGRNDTWLKGWISTPQVFFDAQCHRWYGLINSSPTLPTDESPREPAPSLGGVRRPRSERSLAARHGTQPVPAAQAAYTGGTRGRLRSQLLAAPLARSFRGPGTPPSSSCACLFLRGLRVLGG
jgi:hypothetical protein